ncbi:MAG: MFS transporter [Pseudomonadota bacterium]
MNTPPLPDASASAAYSAKWTGSEAFLVATGFGLIGVSYGLVRFAYGQFLPQMQADLGLSDSQAGLVSSGVFFGSCLALLAAAWLVRAVGARSVAGAAGILASVGLVMVACAVEPVLLSAGLLIAGMSTGLSMPPLVAAICAGVATRRQNSTQAIVNSGSSGGLLISGPVAIWMSGAWQEAYLGFALISAVLTLLVFLAIPKGRPAPIQAGRGIVLTPALGRVLVAAFGLGALSVTIWTFGGVILRDTAGWTDQGLSLFWMVTGVAGLLGASAGYFARLHSPSAVYRSAIVALAISMALMFYAPADPVFAILAAAVFGAAYVMVTGMFVIEAVAAMPSAPAAAVAAAFFMIPAGQVAAAPLLGRVLDLAGPGMLLSITIGICAICLPLLNTSKARPAIARAQPL